MPWKEYWLFSKNDSHAGLQTLQHCLLLCNGGYKKGLPFAPNAVLSGLGCIFHNVFMASDCAQVFPSKLLKSLGKQAADC
jgi:hypothetical protein